MKNNTKKLQFSPPQKQTQQTIFPFCRKICKIQVPRLEMQLNDRTLAQQAQHAQSLEIILSRSKQNRSFLSQIHQQPHCQSPPRGFISPAAGSWTILMMMAVFQCPMEPSLILGSTGIVQKRLGILSLNYSLPSIPLD